MRALRGDQDLLDIASYRKLEVELGGFPRDQFDLGLLRRESGSGELHGIGTSRNHRKGERALVVGGHGHAKRLQLKLRAFHNRAAGIHNRTGNQPLATLSCGSLA